MSDSSPGNGSSPAGLDTTVPHSARIWNYWLGGKDNYAVDRAAGDQFLATFPDIAVIARATRAFMGRAVRYLAAEAASASSWTSAPACPPSTAPTRSPSRSRRTPGSSMWTTTRSC